MSGARGEIEIQICVTPDGAGLPLPAYMTDDAAGCDLFAAVQDDVVLEPGDRALVHKMVEDGAAKYAAEKKLTPRDCTKEM